MSFTNTPQMPATTSIKIAETPICRTNFLPKAAKYSAWLNNEQ